MMSIKQRFKGLRIRSKLLWSYTLAFVVVIGLGSFIMYSILRTTVEANIESELKNSTETLLNMVRTAASVSIKNHLRAVAEKNLEMVQYIYRRHQRGELSEDQARQLAQGLLLSQRIGTTGYIACVSSQGIMKVHPRAPLNVDISAHDFVQEMKRRREGYLEYHWQNPDEPVARPKAMYMTYFEPWDWIITVATYREEFHTLVNVEDFRESVLSLRFGKTGYAFVTDKYGTIILHPKIEGINIFEHDDIPNEPLRTMLRQKSGKIIYAWRNPGETVMRKKLVIFNHIPEYEWIVASSSYLDEFYSPLETVNNVIVFTVLCCLLLILPISFGISGLITRPLRGLIQRMNMGAGGRLPDNIPGESLDEISQLTCYFNSYMDSLELYSESLQAEIAERRQAEEDLRVSEERYRSVMEASPDPMIVYDMDGRVTYLNPSFSDVFGWTLEECRGRKMDHFVPPENWEETRRGLALISAGRMFSSIETRRLTKSGRVIDVSIRGAVYRDRQGNLLGSVITHRDVTEVRRLEKEIMDIGDRERQLIGQDLHDDLGPHLIGIEGLAKVLRRKIAHMAPEASNLVDKITCLLRDATSKTRQLARGLCPVYLVDHGLESSLRELALNSESMFGIDCRFDCQTPVLISDHIAATHVFRIAQEALNNAIRHGRAKQIRIHLSSQDGKIVLMVSDDGCGLPDELETTGMGLRIMGFRAKILNGTLEIHDRQRGGTRVTLTLNADIVPNPNRAQAL